MIIYRIITDEPLGFAVGFKPDQASIEKKTNGADFPFELDEWELVEDDGSGSAEDGDAGYVLFRGDTTVNKVMIRSIFPTQLELDNGIMPVGPDMLIFRSEDELVEFVNETYGEE